MASKSCPNKAADHSTWREMTRLYVRRNENDKRKWIAIGWICDPEHKDYWRGTGCNAILLDGDPTLLVPQPAKPAPEPEDE